MPTLAPPSQKLEANIAKPAVHGEHATHRVLLALILLLCAGLRLFHLGRASLWSDEIFSRYYLDVFGPDFALHQGLSLETNPPAYYFLLRAWIALWGCGDVALRSLSALASVLCIPFTYLLGREVAGKRLGLLAALLYSVCPTSVYFAQETRAYAFLMLSGVILLWSAALFERDPRSMPAIATYLVAGTSCLYLHATGLLFVAACGAAVWLYLARRRPRALARWTGLHGALLLLGIPYYAHVFAASQSGIINYVPPAGLHQFLYSISLLTSGIVTPYPWPGLVLAAAFLLVLGVSLCLNPLPGWSAVTLVGVPCLFVAFVFAVSLRQSILLPRTLVWLVVPLCLLAARQMLAGGIARYAVLLTTVAAFGAGLLFQLTRPGSDKEPLREVVQALSPDLQHADLVVLSPSSDPMVMAYYAPKLKDVRIWDSAVNPTIFGAMARSRHMSSINQVQILQAIRAHQSVVLVSHSFDLGRLNDLRSQSPANSYREWKCGKVVCVAAAVWRTGR